MCASVSALIYMYLCMFFAYVCLHVNIYVDVAVCMCSWMCVCTPMLILIYIWMSLEKLLHGDFEYVGIYVQKTFVGIAYIILIAFYPINNEFKMHVNAIACLYVFIQRLIFFRRIWNTILRMKIYVSSWKHNRDNKKFGIFYNFIRSHSWDVTF